MKYQYDFIISGIKIAVMSDESLNISERFTPFENRLSPQAYDIAVEIVFDDFALSEDFEKLASAVYGKDGKIYSLVDIPDGKYVIREENAVCGSNVRLHIPYSYKEYFCLHGRLLNFLSLERMLICFGRLLIHASGVIYNGKAYVFSAPSGTGKSTQARLWNEHKNADTINGDKIVLGFENEKLIAYGSPTAGTSGIFNNVCAEVEDIFMLEQGAENHLEGLKKRDAMIALYSQAIKSSFDEQYNISVLNLIEKIIDTTGIYKFKCLPDKSAVDYILDYKKGGKKYEK